jgi:hypothetical protein
LAFRDTVAIRGQCADLAERLGFTVWEMVT